MEVSESYSEAHRSLQIGSHCWERPLLLDWLLFKAKPAQEWKTQIMSHLASQHIDGLQPTLLQSVVPRGILHAISNVHLESDSYDTPEMMPLLHMGSDHKYTCTIITNTESNKLSEKNIRNKKHQDTRKKSHK